MGTRGRFRLRGFKRIGGIIKSSAPGLIEALEGRLLLSTIYVDANPAIATHNGAGWGTAFGDLQQALTAAVSGDQIKVADGTFKPTSGTDRYARFQLGSGVEIYGGYAGNANPSYPDDRNTSLYETILSGDLGVPGNSADNSYVVVNASTTIDSVIDGLTIFGGNATHHGYDDVLGGGLSVYQGNPVIRNCRFLGNAAEHGGAIAFWTNASPTIINCSFVGNTATISGGAIWCMFQSAAVLTNCTFAENRASASGAIDNLGSSVTLKNCILWDGSGGELTASGGTFGLSYCDIQGGYAGTGNVNAAPQFVRSPNPGLDGNWGTADEDFGDLRLRASSPCIDAGGNSAVPLGIVTDLAGSARFVDVAIVADTGSGASPIVDMGAYEAQALGLPVARAGGPYSLAEGGSVAVSGATSSANGTITAYEWDFNYDGQSFQIDATGVSPTFSAVGIDGPSTRTIGLRVRDNGGLVSAIATTTVSITNVNPTAGITLVPSSSLEGTTINLGSAVTDPGTMDTKTYRWQVTASTGQVVPDGTAATFSFKPADNGTYTVTLSVTDDDGGVGTNSKTIAVANVAPTVSVTYAQTILCGDPYRLTLGSASDPGTDTVTQYNVDWGDGSMGLYISSGVKTHTYQAPASLNIIVTLVDEDGTYIVATIPVTITAGGATVSGRVFNDADGNGAQGSGEGGLAGWRVYVDADNDSQYDAAELSALTDASGNYTLSGVPAGPVAIRQVVPTGWMRTKPATDSYQLPLIDGQMITGRDFGDVQLGSITGRVFNDADADGVADAGEPSLAGWRVYVDANGNAQFDVGEINALTDTGGNYTLSGVPAGMAVVREVLAAGWVRTKPIAGSYTLNVALGQSANGNDFGNVRTASIGGTVFPDYNGNSVKDAGEAGLAGWKVFLDGDADGQLDAGEMTVTSASGGGYSFTGLLPGMYHLRLVMQSTWKGTAPVPGGFDLTVAAGAALSGKDFGVVQTGSILGGVFADTDRNGVRGGGESGVGGVTIYIDANANGTFDAGESVRTTDAQGTYRFDDLLAGSYQLRPVLPTGWVGTAPASGYRDVTLLPGQIVANMDFGRTGLATLSGRVFSDTDVDGLADVGEAGMANVRVYVDADGDGTWDAGEASVLSAADGAWSIGAATGTLIVRSVLPPGLTQTVPESGFYAVNLPPGGSANDVTFGFAVVSTISGTVFNDVNGNGQLGAAEAGIGGWTVYIDADDDGVMDAGERRITTDSTGHYRLTNLPAGAYRIREAAAGSGWCAGLSASAGYSLVMAAGQNATNVDFGNYQSASISGSVFVDVNRDGMRNPGEAGLAGRTVYIDADGDGMLGGGEIAATTDGMGNFRLDGVAPGTWTLREVVPGGWKETAPAGGSNEAIVTGGQLLSAQLFGNVQVGSISGRVFNDGNADGQAQVGEAGLAGWTVYLDSDNDGALDTGETSVATDDSGSYAFGELAGGTYHVRVAQPAGWKQTTALAAGVTVVAGQDAAAGAMGFAQTASIAGTIFNDRNADGVRTGGEGALKGWKVFLDKDDDGRLDSGEPSIVTDSAGSYVLSDVLAGRCCIRPFVPAGWRSSTSAANHYDEILSAGASLSGRDFAVTQSGRLSGTVFNDANGNGKRDGKEKGLAAWRVFFDTDNDGVLDKTEKSVVTDKRGAFAFDGLAARKYVLRAVGGKAYSPTTPKAGMYSLLIKAARVASGKMFGMRKKA